MNHHKIPFCVRHIYKNNLMVVPPIHIMSWCRPTLFSIYIYFYTYRWHQWPNKWEQKFNFHFNCINRFFFCRKLNFVRRMLFLRHNEVNVYLFMPRYLNSFQQSIFQSVPVSSSIFNFYNFCYWLCGYICARRSNLNEHFSRKKN